MAAEVTSVFLASIAGALLGAVLFLASGGRW